MARKWTDPRDGETWRVTLRGPEGKGLRLVREPDGPAPPNHLVFRSEVDGREMNIRVLDSGPSDPEMMGDWGLQGYLDEARRALLD